MFLLLFAALISTPAYAQTLSMNDISVLLPLPDTKQKNYVLTPESSGSKGALLPLSIFKQFPKLIPESTNDDTYKNLLRVVAVRLDPCFAEGSLVSKCRRQIRMVWQPVYTGSVSARDAAVHTFYEFSDSEWTEIINKWKSFASGKISDELQIHPKILSQGLDGQYWTDMKSLLLQYCGKESLTRVTAMNVQFNEQMWIFMGFDVSSNGTTTGITIPRSGKRAQAINMSPHNTSEFVSGSIRPDAPQNANLAELLLNSKTVSNVLTEDEIKKVIRKAIRFENPELNNPGTVDCATCHIAQSVRQWGQINYPSWDWVNDFRNDRFSSSYNLKNNSPLKTNRFRAFGYFDSDPVISQRVINETAAALSNL